MSRYNCYKKYLKKGAVFLAVFSLSSPMVALNATQEKALGFARAKRSHDKSIGVASGKLVDLILNDAGLMEALGRGGVRGQSAHQVKRYVGNSIEALMIAGKKPNSRQLKGRLISIYKSAKGSDKKQIKELIEKLYSKNSDQLTKDDLVETVNAFIYLANRYGNRSSAILACSMCVNNNLSMHGFKFTMEVLSSRRARDVLIGLPSKPKDLQNYIKSKMRGLGMGNFSRANQKLLPAEEERSLALFLGLGESGTPAQKEFVEAVKSISTNPKGKTSLLDEENPHKLWKLFADNTSNNDLKRFAKIFKEVAEDANSKGEVDKSRAFYRYLEKRAAQDDSLKDELELIKKKKCFFNK